MKIIDAIQIPSFLERFWAKVEKKSPDECWEWKGSCIKGGYSQISLPNQRKKVLTSRVAYTIQHGAFDNALFICHHCDNPKCVNPNHLFAGTQRENIQDASKKGRLFNPKPQKPKKPKTNWDIGSIRRNLEFCKRGHPFDEKNTGIQTKGRYCKICERDRKRRARGSRLAFER